LATTHPDVVHICTPLPSHFPLALQAIEAGVHVLAEKPLTAAYQQAQALLEHAAEKKVLVCPVHQFGFQRGVAKAAAVLGELGEVLHTNFTFCSAGGGVQSGIALDAVVADILPHPLAILQALWPQQPLSEDGWSAISQSHGELHARGSLGASMVNIYVSMHARPTRCDLEIFCRHGSLYLNFFHGYAVVRRGESSRADKIVQPFVYSGKSFVAAAANLAGRAWRREAAYPGLSKLIAGFYAAVQGHGESPIPPAQTLAVAAVRERLIQQAIPAVLTGTTL
jgi:predicted dehydrogenase